MWHCFSHPHQGPATVDLNCAVSTQPATIRDEMATSVDGLRGWSLMYHVPLSLSNKMEKQLSSDLMAYMVWGSSPTSDNLPLNLSNLGVFCFWPFCCSLPFGTSMRVEPRRSVWVVTEKERTWLVMSSFNCRVQRLTYKETGQAFYGFFFLTQWKHRWHTYTCSHWFLKTTSLIS